MKKLLEIREFDKIACNPNFKDEYAYLPKKVFDDLKEFISKSDALDFFKIAFKRNVGDIISASNYVGLLQMKNGYQVQVLPKIDMGTNPDKGNEETKRVFLKMLRSMKDFPNKVFNDANLNIDRMTLYEIFINIYLQEVRSLVKKGLKSAYSIMEDNLNFFKGKLVVSEQIRRNIAHGERSYVQYDEYLLDRAENRLIKTTLLKLQVLTSSAENQKEIRQLLTAFEMVGISTNIQKDLVNVIIDRNTKDYDILMRWSKVFLLNKSFTSFSGEQNAIALLFSMEKVFESYVAQQLKKTLLDFDWDISFQDEGYYLFDSPQQFALRPDIVITRDDGSKIILDTKWKSLVDDQRGNYGISQPDMYQMYAYSKKYEAPEVWLLYPMNEEMRGHPDISFYSYDGVSVRLFFVDVAKIEESLLTLRSLIITK